MTVSSSLTAISPSPYKFSTLSPLLLPRPPPLFASRLAPLDADLDAALEPERLCGAHPPPIMVVVVPRLALPMTVKVSIPVFGPGGNSLKTMSARVLAYNMTSSHPLHAIIVPAAQ